MKKLFSIILLFSSFSSYSQDRNFLTKENTIIKMRKYDSTAVKALIDAAAGSGVLSVSRTNGLGISASVANPTTTPNITIAVDTSDISILSRQRAALTYQTILTNPVTGTGTLNYMPKWTPNGTTLGNSSIQDDASTVTIGLPVIGTTSHRVPLIIGSNSTSGELQLQASNNTNFGIIRIKGTGANTTYFSMGNLPPDDNNSQLKYFSGITQLNAISGGNVYLSIANSQKVNVTTAATTVSNQLSVTTAGAASTPALSLTGSPFAGTGATAVPLIYANFGATAPTTWSTNKTVFGINAESGFTGDYLRFFHNGSDILKVVQTGGNTTNIDAGSSRLHLSTSTGILSFNDGNSTATFSSGSFNIGNRGISTLRDLAFQTSNSFDIGSSGTTVRSGYFGTQVFTPVVGNSTNNSTFYSSTDNGNRSSGNWYTVSNTDNSGGGDIVFGAGSPAFGSISEYMRILSTGNVGIGTTAPASKFHIANTATATANSEVATLNVTGTLTARNTAADVLYSMRNTQVFTAAANNQSFIGLDIAPTYSLGAFTGTTMYPLRVLAGSGNARAVVKSNTNGNLALILGDPTGGGNNGSLQWYRPSGGAESFAIAGGNAYLEFQSNGFGGFYFNPTSGYGLSVGTPTANSTLHTNGSFASAYVAKTANYTAGFNDYTVHFTANTCTFTFPTAVGITGRIYVIRNDTGVDLSLATTSSQTVNGASPGTQATGTSKIYQSTGSNWISLN